MVESGTPSPNDPTLLADISAPVLLLHETQSKPWFNDSANYITAHVNHVYTCEIKNAAHFGPCTHPEAIAEAVGWFFTTHLDRNNDEK